jgi:hypothetical protein
MGGEWGECGGGRGGVVREEVGERWMGREKREEEGSRV